MSFLIYDVFASGSVGQTTRHAEDMASTTDIGIFLNRDITGMLLCSAKPMLILSEMLSQATVDLNNNV